MKQFEIWTVAGGEHTSKPRPCLIMQADGVEDFDTVIIAPVTGFSAAESPYRVQIASLPETGLHADSYA